MEISSFIDFLVLHKLSTLSLLEIASTLSSLQWDDASEEVCIKAILLRTARSEKIEDVAICARLLSLIQQARPTIVMKVIDELMNTVMTAESSYAEKIGAVRFIGQLFLQKVVSLDFFLSVGYFLLENNESIEGTKIVCSLVEVLRNTSKPAAGA